MNLDLVTTFLNRHEAQLAKGRLESAGIESNLSSDDCGGMEAGLSFGSAIKLLVKSADLAKAKEILEVK